MVSVYQACCLIFTSRRRIEECQTADEFYSIMGCLTQEMLEHNLINSNELMQVRFFFCIGQSF